jgi:hypothetical protein
MNHKMSSLTRLARWLVLLAFVVGVAPTALAAPSSAPAAALSAAPLLQTTNTLTLNVVDATTNASVTTYRYIINIDNTGTTDQRLAPNGDLPYACTPADPTYPANCKWVSIAGAAPASPIYTQGDQTDFGPGITFPASCTAAAPCRYLISVLAPSYKIDGAHFTVPLTDPGLVTVQVQPNPLPAATVQAEVFQDTSPVNGAPDVPAERGIPGFQGQLVDYLGPLITDVFGNPLCTEYDAGGNPIPGTGGSCYSKCYIVDALGNDTEVPPDADGLCPIGAEGKIKIPNVGPNRYALSLSKPAGSNWIQTTTLEGNHDWDAWVMEGATGLDTEFVVAGEPFPAIFFGYVNPGNQMAAGGGTITGVVAAVRTYVPAKGGIIGGEPMVGSVVDHVIDSPWLALSDLGAGDTAVWVGQGNPDGSFTIPNVPDGSYTLSWWDEPQDYILGLQNVTVVNGEFVDLGMLPLGGWWTFLEGYVYDDVNGNGTMDAGEPGLAGYPVGVKKRENSLMDRGTTAIVTDQNGYYFMESLYPITQWLVIEAYDDLHYTTGVTYQADNQPTETTVLGSGVDVSVLPIIGLRGRLDWGKRPYDPGTNGGIVGTVTYDTTRNELDPRYAVTEIWQPGIPDVNVNLFAPVACTPANGACDPTGRYQLAPDGSIAKGQLLNVYKSETWTRPTSDCVPRDVNGDRLAYPADQQVTNKDTDCLEGPLMGVQFGPYPDLTDPANPNFGAAVDGNYGFGDGCFGATGGFDPATGLCVDGSSPTVLIPGDYLVQVEIPNDALGRPMYKLTKEEDINIFSGDQWVPQIPPAACAGALHTVHVVNDPAQALFDPLNPSTTSGVYNPDFFDNGGSPYEGMQKPLCDTKLVTVSTQKSTAPNFNLFTDVPIPVRFWGLLVDDLNFSSDPRSLVYGEKAGVPFAPVGIYDYTNRLVYTTESDFNGLFDVLLPSTTRISCPTPSGVCANLYRFVGNDPGIPGRLNPNYNPQFRTIAAEFEAFPGLLVPADLAPTQVGVTIQLPGGQVNATAICALNDPTGVTPASTPELFAVSQPYADLSTGAAGAFTVRGQGFGATKGTGQVTLDGAALPTTSWSDTSIAVTVPANTPAGPHQLEITNGATAQSTINGLTFHVLGDGFFPSTPVLDNFNRSTNANNQGLGPNWSNDGNTPSIYRIPSLTSGFPNQVQVRGTGNTSWLPTVFSPDQEAYFTFTKISTVATEQALLLKFNGTSPSANGAALIEVAYNAINNTVVVRTKSPGQNLNSAVTRAAFHATFAAGDQLGARARADGTVRVYNNGALIGQMTIPTTGAGAWPQGTGGGRIGVRFSGPTNANDARFDDFGGGNVDPGYQPNVYEVGPGKTYDPGLYVPLNPSHAIQNALDAAAASPGDDLVVVYPGTPQGDRINPRGAYYENIIIHSPVKLQGVGPGGVIAAGNVTVPGSIIDGSAFAGDTVLSTDWGTKIGTLTWVGNQNVYEGQVIYVLAETTTQFGAAFKAAIDGFDIRGGDQAGQANTINQGGAIFANAYARNLQITNNLVQNNSGAYGTVRIGTPNLPAPDTSQHNEKLRIANNRIIANAGTNLAGGIGIFAGADGYEVANNDICGDFSAEYGGGLSVYGFSPNGQIHHNRVYFNQSYDEGGGVIVAGQLPADPTMLSPGSGPVDIYNNLIQANLANDDGGGIRFLMAGNFPMNVYNNMIVNNVSTHEGGGVGLNDAPNVRVYNTTIMKNITTATAVTSSGSPAPAGLSTSANSVMLQATLPAGSPIFSNPLLFNNIFWDNRAGARGLGTVTGIGGALDPTPINYWDLGVADSTGLLSPTNSILQTTIGTNSSPTNLSSDPMVVTPYDLTVTFNAWRTNPPFIGAILVTVDLPTSLTSNYHLTAGSPAVNAGAASKAVPSYQQPLPIQPAPLFDYDNQGRPAGAGFDIGADEVVP